MRMPVSLVMVFAMTLAMQAPVVCAFQLAEPTNGMVIKPGDALKVKVAIPHGLPVVRVTYTLYEEDRAPEDKVEAPPQVVAQSAPFEAALQVPIEAAGGVRLLPWPMSRSGGGNTCCSTKSPSGSSPMPR
jgi:hypothetical protein